MESCFLELKVISCKDLKAFNFFQKLSVYALVSIGSASDDDKKVDQKQQQIQRTPTDREGDGYPEWNHTIRFDVSKSLFQDYRNVFIHFDLRHEGAMFGDKIIGQVHVPLSDLIQESNNGVVRFVTYEVRNTDGKSNGVLSFSFKVAGKDQGLARDYPASQIAGYPVFSHHHHHHHYQSTETQFSLSEEADSESLDVRYPVVDPLENMFHGPQPYPSSSGNLCPSQETYFLPEDAYYQLRPSPPPPPPTPYPPSPATMTQGPCYHPPLLGPSPWAPSSYVHFTVHDHVYNTHGPRVGSAANGPLETWPNGWQGVRNHLSSSWNGR